MRRAGGVPVALVAGLGVVAAALLWVKMRGAGGAGLDVGVGVGQFVGGVASGTVLGIGDAIGVPRTDLTECERAKLEGRTWDASFACPAGDFLGYLWS